MLSKHSLESTNALMSIQRDPVFKRFAGNFMYSTLDLVKGYYQITIARDSMSKKAFSTPFGHYEYLRLPFGINGTAATFQRALQTIYGKNTEKYVLYI